MTRWIPTAKEFLHETAKHWFYASVVGGLTWLGTFLWAAVDDWSPLAVWLGGLGAGAFIAIIYVSIRIAIDRKKSGVHQSVARDVSLYDAICRIFLGRWSLIPVKDGNLDLNVNGFQALHDLLEHIRQLAFDGRLPIWGKKPGYLTLWERPDAQFWNHHRIDYLSVTGGNSTELHAVPMDASGHAMSLRELMTSRAAVDSICRDATEPPSNDVNSLGFVTGTGEPFDHIDVNQYGVHHTIYVGIKNSGSKRITNCKFYRTYVAFTNDREKTLIEGPFSLEPREVRYVTVALFNETKQFPHTNHLIGLSMPPAAFSAGIMQPRLPIDRSHVVSFVAESTDTRDAVLHCELSVDTNGKLRLNQL
jgi:hypothetical protein